MWTEGWVVTYIYKTYTRHIYTKHIYKERIETYTATNIIDTYLGAGIQKEDYEFYYSGSHNIKK